MAIRDGKWISLKSKNRNTQSLVQSWVRTKAKSFDDYKKAMDLQANASNNTVYADAKGNIAYWHGNFIPIRDTQYNWAEVVDGSTSATAWKGLHPVNETVRIYNPTNGWLQNCNSTPFSVAGKNSPQKNNYPTYMAPDGENFRGVAAVKLLSQPKKYTLENVIATGYDTYMPAFEILVPALVKAYAQLPINSQLYDELKAPIEFLKDWDYRSGENSIAATLAMEWAPRISNAIQKVYIDPGEKDQVQSTIAFAKNAKPDELLNPFKATVEDLTKRFGKWQMPWGEVNRFQRLTGELNEKYDDNLPSLPVGFGSAMWGQLPSYRSNTFNTNKRYGFSGNSFVCVVEFGKKIKAKSVLAGGNSGNPNSKHFNDQTLMYSKGQFKEVLFYKEDVLKNVERSYRP
jgi:acyl-homoserine lactone acylase PvdQ